MERTRKETKRVAVVMRMKGIPTRSAGARPERILRRMQRMMTMNRRNAWPDQRKKRKKTKSQLKKKDMQKHKQKTRRTKKARKRK